MTATLDRPMADLKPAVTLAKPTTYTRREIIGLIRRDGACFWITAWLVLFFMEDRTKRHLHGRMTWLQMLLIHRVMLRIIPDGAIAKPGSAHAALNQLAPKDRPFIHSTCEFLGRLYCSNELGRVLEAS